MSEQIVYRAAELRGKRDFREAIDHVLGNLSRLDDTSRLPGLREAFLAAEEAGFQDDARRLAVMLAKEDPNLPSIQHYLR